MAIPKNFYNVSCIIVDQHGKKDQTYLGRFTSRKKADEEIRKTKIITVANKADAEFIINVSINYMALRRLPPSTSKLRFVEKNQGEGGTSGASYTLGKPTRQVSP